MSKFEPNHICKNIYCTKGKDGGRKHYYACNYCTYTMNWRSVACCEECFAAYQKQVIDARTKGKDVSLLPERTDMTKKEVKELLEKPAEQVIEETKEQLKEYIADEKSVDFTEAVQKINEEIDAKKITPKRKTKSVENND